jgi:hypothetical protein
LCSIPISAAFSTCRRRRTAVAVSGVTVAVLTVVLRRRLTWRAHAATHIITQLCFRAASPRSPV